MFSKYTVSDYCKAAGINRSEFYYLYSNRSEMFITGLTASFQKALRFTTEDSFAQIIYRMLEQMEEEKYFYINSYNLIRKEDLCHARHRVRKVFWLALRDYAMDHEGISNKNLESSTNLLYSRLYEWISHNFEDSVVDVFQTITLFIPFVEGHRCSFYRKYFK